MNISRDPSVVGIVRMLMATDSQKALADKLFPIRADQDDTHEIRNIPPEQRRLHTETADLTVSSIHQYLANNKIEIPEFQRGYVWTRSQASRLIESLLIQCPIPVIYFSQNHDNKLVVIDGNQRLLSIKLFMNDGFELQGLTTYPELNGTSWSTLDPRFRDHIQNRTLRCITILKDTHPQIKFDVFERLNTGSVKLNAQELRHGINHGPLMELVDKLAKSDNFKALAGLKSDKRMKGAELVLRFFALSESRSKYEKPLSSFLDRFSAERRTIDLAEVDRLHKSFDLAVSRTTNALGKLSFRLYTANFESLSPFNSAIYDAEMIGFLETTNHKLLSGNYNSENLRAHIAPLFTNDTFVNAVTRATSDEHSVRNRIDLFLQRLNSF